MRGARVSRWAIVPVLLLGMPSQAYSSTAPMHPGFSAVLRSRSLEKFEPKVFQDGEGMHRIADLPRTGLDSVLRVAALHVGLKEVYVGKCLVPPPGVPAELKADSVIRFEDPHSGSDISVWWRPLYDNSEQKEAKGIAIDGVFSRRHYNWETASSLEASVGEMPWQPLITETKKAGDDAASPFAWWRATLRGSNTEHLDSNMNTLIWDVETALKDAISMLKG